MSSVSARPTDSAAIAHKNFIDSIGRFDEHTSDGFTRKVGGWRMLASGLPAALLNIVTVGDDSAQAADLRAAVQMMLDANLPYSVALRQGTDDHLESAVLDLGLAPSDRSPVMIGSDIHMTPWPAELSMVGGPSAVAQHAAVVATAFGLPEDLVARMAPEALAADPDVDVVVGVSGGEAVMTAIGVTVDGVTGVYNVATLDAYRGRGYGAASTSAVVKAAFDRGATATSLQSSDIGLSVYEAMGYRTVATHAHYVIP
jgi:ribosomal protein S18 acetylase RimI-like enzyme